MPGAVRAVAAQPSRRRAGGGRVEAGVRRSARRLRLPDGRPDAPGARRRHGAARSAHADGIRVVGALEGGRREQLRAQPRGPDDDALGARRPGLRDVRRVHRHGGPSVRPPLDLRRPLEPARRPSRWLSADRLWKVRASGGSGFRAPTIGELYYPFSGNPDLKPERSVSWEVGAERYVGGRARRGLALLERPEGPDRLRLRDVPELQRRAARARAASRSAGGRTIVAGSRPTSTYTYLDADRPRHGRPRSPGGRATGLPSASTGSRCPASISSRGVLYVGDRADNDPLTGAPVEDPSYVRVDLIARWQVRPSLAPYLRLVNLTRSPLR